MPFDPTKPFELIEGRSGFDPTKPFEVVTEEDDQGFEAPITPEEAAKLPVPLKVRREGWRDDVRDTIQKNVRDPLGLPGRLGAAIFGSPEPPSSGEVAGIPLKVAGEAMAGAVSRLVRGQGVAEAITQFGRGPDPLSHGQQESLLNVIPTEMARLVPTIAASVGLASLGVPPSAATAAPFYAQTFAETGDPVAALKSGAIGAIIPGVGSAGRAGGELMAQRVAGRLGAGELATRGLEATGRLVGSQSLVGGLLTASAAPELVELLKTDPEGYKRELLTIVGMNLAFEVPHLPANARQVMAKESIDSYFGSPEYKRGIDNLLATRQTQARMQGTTPIPPAELARLRGNYEAFKAQRMGVSLVSQQPTAEQIQTIEVAANAARSGLPQAARTVVGEVVKPAPPVVPETAAEPQTPVLREIKEAGADTIKKIQALFPDANLTREQARVFRDLAYPESKPVAEPSVEAPKVEPVVEPTIKAEEIDSTLIVPPEIKAPDVVPVVEPKTSAVPTEPTVLGAGAATTPSPEPLKVTAPAQPIPETKPAPPSSPAAAPVTVPDVKGEMKVPVAEPRTSPPVAETVAQPAAAKEVFGGGEVMSESEWNDVHGQKFKQRPTGIRLTKTGRPVDPERSRASIARRDKPIADANQREWRDYVENALNDGKPIRNEWLRSWAQSVGPERSESLLNKYGYDTSKKPWKGPEDPELVLEPKPAATEGGVETPSFSPEALQSEGGRTLGITPSGPSIQTDAIGKFLKKTKQAFSVSGKLPREIHEMQTAMEGQRRAGEFDIRMTQRDFENTLGEVYGLNRAQRLGGGTRRIPPADVQLMDEYLQGRTTPEQAAKIPTPIRGQLDNMRSQIEGWSQRTIDTLTEQMNRLDPESVKAKNLGNLIDTIQSNMDVYVHRSYKFFDSKNPAPDWYDKVPLGDRIKAEQYLSTARGITPEQARSELLNWLSDLRDESSGGTGGKLGSKDLTMFLQRKQIPAELRAVLGEYRNPLVNYSKSVGKMAQFVAKQKFLEEVKAKGMGNYLFEEGSNPPGFNARIAPEGSDAMSPLSGLRTSKDIADAFQEMDSPTVRKGVLGNVVRGYLVVNAWTKFANTAQSIMTHSRNLMSRIPMAIHAGHVDPRYAGTALKAIWQDFSGSDKTWRPFLNRMYKLGVIGDTSRASELREVFKDAQLQDVAPAELVSWSLGRALKKTFVKLPGDVYRLTDEFGNIFGFMNERATQKRIHPDWSDAQLDAEAASVVRSIYPTYSEAPKIVQAFRQQPLYGPFVNFPYQAWRNVVNGVARSVHEIHSDNAIERQVGWKRLGLQIAAASASHIAQEVSKLILGITSQEEDDMRRYLAEYDKGATLIFTGKDPKTGELTYINASRLDPYSNVTDGVNSIVSGIRQGKPVLEIMKDVVKDTFRPFTSEQMLGKAFIEARNGITDMGRDIFNPTDSSWTKLTKQTGHIITSLLPGTIQRAQKRIIPALRDEQPRFGRKLEPGREIAREVTGIAVEKFNFKTALGFKVRAYMENSNAAEDVFRQTATRTQKTTPEQVVEAYRESEIRRRAYWEEMRADYLAALRRGVTPNEAAGILMARGLPKGEAKSIYDGRYIPQKVTEHVYKRAQEIGRNLPLKDLFQEAVKGFPKNN